MPSVVADEKRWQEACGPLEATICTLVDLGWKPIAPDSWFVDEDTAARVGGTAYARAHIAARAREDMKAKVAKHAEKHTYGQGIGNKILLQLARRAQRHLRRQGKNAEAIAIDYIVTGCLNDPASAMDGKYEMNTCATGAVATRWQRDCTSCTDVGTMTTLTTRS